MCGIVGLIIKGDNGLTTKHEAVFREMLYADAIRGFDSTGVVGINKYGDFGTIKEAVQAAIFIPKLENSDLWKEMYTKGKVWIGHNRKKTIGDISDETAHPFVIDKTFAMVHNGTLIGYKQLHNESTTDSEALAHVLKDAFSHKDYKKELEDTLGNVYGAYALAMFDQIAHKVFLLRNKERPLWRLDCDDAYYFASEPMMATWILVRNGYTYDKIKAVAIEEHVLHSYDLEKGFWSTETLNPKKYSVAKGTTPTTLVTSTLRGNKPITQSALKHLRRAWVGKTVDFWIENYFELNMPKTLDEGETEICFYSESDEIKWPHCLWGDLDLAKFHMSTEDDIYDAKWRATIDMVALNDTNTALHITVVDVKPYAASQNADDTFKKILATKSLSKLKSELVELDGKLTDHQKDLYNAAIELRIEEVKKYEKLVEKNKNISHDELMAARKDALSSALRTAKSNKIDIGFRMELHPVKHVWFNKDTGETIYESPVAVLH